MAERRLQLVPASTGPSGNQASAAAVLAEHVIYGVSELQRATALTSLLFNLGVEQARIGEIALALAALEQTRREQAQREAELQDLRHDCSRRDVDESCFCDGECGPGGPF